MLTIRRPPSLSRPCASVVALLVLLVAVVGCGGEEDAEARRACISEAQKAAEAAVVASFYEQGKLGTRAEIEREIDHADLRFFDEQDRMLPYRELSPEAKAVFNRWVGSNRVGDVTLEARREAREAVEPDC